MTLWFDKNRKSLSVVYGRYWEKPQYFIKNNGARKGVDSCYDLNICIWRFVFSYTNWNYK